MKKGGKKVAKQRDANLKRDKKRTTQLDHREGKRFKEQVSVRAVEGTSGGGLLGS